MKKIIISIAVAIACAIGISFLVKTTDADKNNDDQKEATAEKLPWNVTVFLDLSDRLLHGNPISQTEIDTTIVNHIVDLFVEDCVKSKRIIGSKNSFQVLFYPTPSISTINTLTADLKVDLSKIPANEKRQALINLQTNVAQNLGIIYDTVLTKQSWLGCDIWDFFSSKRIDKYCIKPGYRNIIVILTDGYLFYAPNKIKIGNAYSYILPQTLNDSNSSLIVKRDGLTDLEVLFLEINPFTPAQRGPMMSTIGNWLESMGVENDSYLINETDIPKNTEIVIDSFFN